MPNSEVRGQQPRSGAQTVPDLEAAKRIPIDQVVDKLGLDRQGGMIRCWRPANHQHDDRTPSVGIHGRKNRVKCFVCDGRSLSTVDLVASVLGLGIFEALLWLDQHFKIPALPKGRHLKHRSGGITRLPVGLSGNWLEEIVRSGLWGQMGAGETRLLVTIQAFTDHETGCATLSYAALRRYAGIHSNTTVSTALKKLVNIGAIEIEGGRGGDGLATCNSYRITLESSRLLALMRDCYTSARKEIEAERVVRKRARFQRAKAIEASASGPPSSR